MVRLMLSRSSGGGTKKNSGNATATSTSDGNGAPAAGGGGGEGYDDETTTTAPGATAPAGTAASAPPRKRSWLLAPSSSTAVRRRQATATSSDRHQTGMHPMYQYAINEYAQTVAAGTSNDAGGGGIWGSSSNEDQQQVGGGAGGENNQQDGYYHNILPGGGSSSGSGSWTSLEVGGGYEELNDVYQHHQYHPTSSSSSYYRHRYNPTIDEDDERMRGLGRHPYPTRRQHPIGRSHSSDVDSLQAHPPSSPPPLGSVETGTFDDAGGPQPASAAAAQTLQGQLSSDSSMAHGPAHQHHENRYYRRAYSYPTASSTTGPSPPSPLPHLPYHAAAPHLLHPIRSQFESGMPDATYEESYGDAYTGGPIKYVYPSGYQSMRPRSCPWKISILVCLLFTWMSIFIVGHCSDQVMTNDEYSYYNNKNNNGGENAVVYDDDVAKAAAAAAAAADDVQHDDKEVVLQTRWCGSRPLYLLWVTSMLITGLAAAYCSVIGYIKVRDFAVGNMRSQPPGVVVTGKSDYYVRIGDTGHDDPSTYKAARDGRSYAPTRSRDASLARSSADAAGAASGSDAGNSSTVTGVYRPTIYQSDGTPQFWGSHIYRPTQAAVAVTSR